MPEGPSIVLLREQVARFARKRILHATGNAKIDLERLQGRSVRSFRSWGKHFLIDFGSFALRIHFLMFGSWTIDTRKDREPRLRLVFKTGELNFYSCAIREVNQPLQDVYDWSTDVLSDEWNVAAARRRLRRNPDNLVCDALLDQTVFSGVGNIIKNEVLYRIGIHPLSRVGSLPPKKLRDLVDDARAYSFLFLDWKRDFVLRKHWQVHTKRTCPRCKVPLQRGHLGLTKRRSFWCEHCQPLYGESVRPKPKRSARRAA